MFDNRSGHRSWGSLELSRYTANAVSTVFPSSWVAASKQPIPTAREPSENERGKLWREQVKKNQLVTFDRWHGSFTWYAIEEVAKAAKESVTAGRAPHADETEAIC